MIRSQYLKTEHPFTPEEIDALLQFQDPLDVALWCKEDNPHQHRFPICELLDLIDASERFPLAKDNHVFEDTFAQFREVITKNYYSFRDEAAGWTLERVFNNAEEIAAVTKTYRDLMTDYTPVLKEMLVVLQYRGQIHAILSNVSALPQQIRKGDRIGQLVILPVVIADFVAERGDARGTGSFGSTGA